ncbi:unnamed protein product, partial [Brassica oleracea]
FSCVESSLSSTSSSLLSHLLFVCLTKGSIPKFPLESFDQTPLVLLVILLLDMNLQELLLWLPLQPLCFLSLRSRMVLYHKLL